MIASAAWPREKPEDERLLWIDPGARAFIDSRVGDLPSILRRGDLLVVNDAATLPASLRALRDDGVPFEIRLLAHESPRSSEAREWTTNLGESAGSSEARERTTNLGDGGASTCWRAVLFGRGDWRQRTEERPAPPRLFEGERVRVAGGAIARVLSVDAVSPRLLRLAFEGDAASMWRAIYSGGRPVQYSYLEGPLALWHVQSGFAARPWAVESPSAGRPLTFSVLERLRGRGVAVAAVTHAAGLSSTGDAALDAILPLEERYDVPAATVRAVADTRARGGRVVAVGTTVVRALEGCAAAHGGELVAGEGQTYLRIGAHSELHVADGLLTGIHERATTHFDLMLGFVPLDLLDSAIVHAERAGYLQHEFGDSVLVLPR
jgi:S-adenosylmethionine:tRNA ribosyltransferase-isomerase